MADSVYQALARVFGAILPAAGAAALVGGGFAHRFVAEQLQSEDITMPAAQLIDKELQIGLVSVEDAEMLRPHAGQTLTTGQQARIYADNYVLAHMRVAARREGVPDEKATYAGVGDLAAQLNEQLKTEIRQQHPELGSGELSGLAKMEVGDPETEYETARQIHRLYELRSDNFFMGNAIRGMLLNAYGWWLVGLVARVAGWVLIGVGGVLTAIGLVPKRR